MPSSRRRRPRKEAKEQHARPVRGGRFSRSDAIGLSRSPEVDGSSLCTGPTMVRISCRLPHSCGFSHLLRKAEAPKLNVGARWGRNFDALPPELDHSKGPCNREPEEPEVNHLRVPSCVRVRLHKGKNGSTDPRREYDAGTDIVGGGSDGYNEEMIPR